MIDQLTSPGLLEPPEVRANAGGTWWARDRFSSYEGRDGRCPGVIDVTGPVRHLFFGPYATLEPGVWRATVHIHLCADAARRTLALQFGIEPVFTTVDLPYGSAGSHRVEIVHTITQSGRAQVRLWLKNAAFHGEVRFAGAAIERIGDG